MKRIVLTLITAALILTMFAACGEKKSGNNSTAAGNGNDTESVAIDAVTGEGEYEWVLVESQLFDPQGNPVDQMPVETEPKIKEDALVQTIEDITGLDDIIAGYEYCYNYDFVYDEGVHFEGGYYLVSDTALIEAYKAECAKYFEEGRFPPCFIEKEGKYFYKPVEDISLTMDMGEDGTGINYSEDNICELSYTDNHGIYHFIELAKGDNGFLISYTTYNQ